MKLILLTLFFSFTAYCETQVFEAVAKNEGSLVYYERHTVVYDEETLIKSLTEYIDPDGKVIGSLRSDYTHSLSAPEFILRDGRNQSLQGIHWQQNKVEMFSRERPGKRVSTRALSSDSRDVMISGPGLFYFVAKNMEKIISSDGLSFKYIIPGRLEAFDFLIKPLAHNDQQAEFEVKIKSWLMRIFSPRLKLIYDVKKRRLLSFEGLSNIRDSEGEMMSVDIQYLYKN